MSQLGMARIVDRTERLEVCKSCNKYDLNLKICGKCGCFMPLKTALPFMCCPLKKW